MRHKSTYRANGALMTPQRRDYFEQVGAKPRPGKPVVGTVSDPSRIPYQPRGKRYVGNGQSERERRMRA